MCLSKLRDLYTKHVTHDLTLKMGDAEGAKPKRKTAWNPRNSGHQGKGISHVYPESALCGTSFKSAACQAQPQSSVSDLLGQVVLAPVAVAIHSFIYSLNRYLTLACSVPGPVLGTRNIVTDKAGLAPSSRILILRWMKNGYCST